MGTPCQIDVKLAKIEGRKNATVKDRNGSTYKAPVFVVSTTTTLPDLNDLIDACVVSQCLLAYFIRMVKMCGAK